MSAVWEFEEADLSVEFVEARELPNPFSLTLPTSTSSGVTFPFGSLRDCGAFLRALMERFGVESRGHLMVPFAFSVWCGYVQIVHTLKANGTVPHGPFVATGPKSSVTLVSPPGSGYNRSLEIGRAVKATGAGLTTLMAEGDDEMVAVADNVVTLPEMGEALSPIVYLVPLQLFTYWLALDRGKNPDIFRLDDPAHLAARQRYSL